MSLLADYDVTDRQTLLSDTDVATDRLKAFKLFVSDVLRNHLFVFAVVCDVFCVLTFTSVLLAVNAWSCEEGGDDQEMGWCEPFEPVDKVEVDLSFDLLVHCDSPRSCVAWAELQGGQYNFILGDEELVYVGRGYQCGGGGTLRLQMLITRYTWDPSQPVYRVPNEVVLRHGEVIEKGLRCGKISPHFTVNTTCGVYGPWCGASNLRDQFPWTSTVTVYVCRYGEVIEEGLRCGKISPHFTVNTTCGVYGPWCGASNLRDQFPWTSTSSLALSRDLRLNPWYEPPLQHHHPYLAFDVDRVYDRHHALYACNRTLLGM